MRTLLPMLAAAALSMAPLWAQGSAASPDTIRIEIGSNALDGRVYKPHAALVRVYVGDSSRVVATWTNELTLGDSAGRPVMRWVTKGTSGLGTDAETTWELLQTYDAETLAPYTYSLSSSSGGFTRLSIAGGRVRGTKRVPGDSTVRQVDDTLERAGFFAGASDLVPLAVGLKAGVVMTAPVWSPGMTRAEGRIFTVLGRDTVEVEGKAIEAWKVEERRETGGAPLATWWLLEESPYMVYGEMAMSGGRVRKMTEVEIPMSRE